MQVLLDGMPADLRRIQSLYERDVASHELSPDLLKAIRHFVSDLRSVLDWTATDLDRAFGKSADRSPYFPMFSDPARFAKAVSKDFPSVPEPVRAAMERHQPFQPGKARLAHLPTLTRVNGHQDFTEQTRKETKRWEQRTAGGSVSWGEGVSWSGGVFVGDRPMGDPATTTLTVFVGWNFVDPPVPVLPTLHELTSLVTATVVEVRAAAGI